MKIRHAIYNGIIHFIIFLLYLSDFVKKHDYLNLILLLTLLNFSTFCMMALYHQKKISYLLLFSLFSFLTLLVFSLGYTISLSALKISVPEINKLSFFKINGFYLVFSYVAFIILPSHLTFYFSSENRKNKSRHLKRRKFRRK